MSHTTTIDSIVISDVNALHGAVRGLQQQGVKCDLVANSKPRAYFGNQAGLSEAAAYTLVLHDSPYDVGFYQKTDGSFEVRCDLWAGHIGKVLGVKDKEADQTQAQLGKLYQEYAISATVNRAMMQGYSAQVQRNATTGEATVRITGY